MENPRSYRSIHGNGAPLLSAEVVIQILRYVNPVDILAVRKASCEMYRVTKTRIVWLVAVERICENHGIFKPTYPMENMTIEELEHTALSPHRFVRLIKKDGDRNRIVPAYQTRPLECRRNPKSATGNGAVYTYDSRSTMFLVPGGRFLFTSGNGTIQLWDLGHFSTSPANPFPLATLEQRSVRMNLEAIGPSSDGTAIMVAVRDMPMNNPALVIYRVDPCSSTVKFSEEGRISLEPLALPPFVQILNGIALILSRQTLTLWDWGKDTGCRWNVSLHDSLSKANMVSFCGEAIFLSDDSGNIGVYDTPPLFPNSIPGSLGAFDLIENPLKFLFRLPGRGEREGEIAMSASPNWQQSLDRHMALLTTSESDGCNNLSLYAIRSIQNANNGFTPSAFPASGGSSYSVYGNGHSDFFDEATSALFTCDGNLVFCTESADKDLVVTVLPVPVKATQDEFAPLSRPLVTRPRAVPFHNLDESFAICPMSGRLVYFFPGSPWQLRVSDYLTPPNSLVDARNCAPAV